jgi:tetratricopeptide (TPR) repeat protein
MKIVENIMKFRGRLPNGVPESRFSLLIDKITNEETDENALQILQKVYDLNEDAFIAQQMARVNISRENWDAALEYAELAIRQRPDNSYLWDTVGRVYQNRLAAEYKSLSPEYKLSSEKVVELLNVTVKGCEVFRKVQELSENEKRTLPNNNAGYYGELEIIECCLHCLNSSECFESISDLKKCLCDEKYYPPKLLRMLENDDTEQQRNLIRELKSFNAFIHKTLKRLDDEQMQLKVETVDEYRYNSFQERSKKIDEIHSNLVPYIGESGDELLESMNPSSREASLIRRRRIFTLGGNSLGRMFQLRKWQSAEKILLKIRELSIENIHSEYTTPSDYQTAIASCLILASLEPQYLRIEDLNFTFNDVLEWSCKLYSERDTKKQISLEPFLFFVMLNWPKVKMESDTQSSDYQSVLEGLKSTVKTIKSAMHHWKEAYFAKWPSQKDGERPYTKKDKTIFFLSNGSDLASVVSFNELVAECPVKGERFWETPYTLRKLKRFKGTLVDDGEYILVHIEPKETHSSITLELATSFPIRNTSMYNKVVYFVIGFSWRGPKAFDIKTKDPTEELDKMTSDHKVPKPPVEKPQPMSYAEKTMTCTHTIIEQQLETVCTKLKHIENIKGLTNPTYEQVTYFFTF